MFSTPKRKYGPIPMEFVPWNYFGDGSDGANTTGSQDTPNAYGDLIVKNYTSVNVSDAYGFGLKPGTFGSGYLIYCQGDFILSGSINLNGVSQVGTGSVIITGSNDISFYRINPSGTKQNSNSNVVGFGSKVVSQEANQQFYWYRTGYTASIALSGSAGGIAGNSGIPNGGTGNNSSNSCAGGGGGGYYGSGGVAGLYGMYYGGGRGGNGDVAGNGTIAQGGAGGANIILIVRGNLLISSTGTITANGNVGKNGTLSGVGGGGGGGGGGGSIRIFYAGTYINSGSITANGGLGGTGAPYGGNGGSGGNGSIIIQKISP